MSDERPQDLSGGAFKWACLAFAVAAIAGLFWMLNGLRTSVDESMQALNHNLPEIMANTKRSTETLAALSEDIKELRNLAGVSNQTRDRSLVAFADRLLDLVEASECQIGLQKKVFGSGLKELLPAAEWVVDARKEALWLSFRARSKRELLERLTKNKYGSAWFIQPAEGEPQSLLDWLSQHDPETAELAREMAGGEAKPGEAK